MTNPRAALVLLAFICDCRVFFRNTTTPQCRVNKDCESADICFFKQCITPEREVVSDLFVETKPPARLRASPQQSAFVATRSRGDIDWRQPTRWRGTIRDLADGFRHFGLLTLTRAALIPKRPISFSTTLPEGDAFQLDLEPGSYEVTLIPDKTLRRGPIRLQPWLVEATDNFDVSIPYPNTFSTITGSLKTTPSDLIFPGFEGATVYARVDDQPLTSTIASSASNGSFELLLFGITGKLSLFVGPSNKNQTLPEVEFRTSNTGAALTLSRSTVLGDVYLGNVGSPVVVAGSVTTADGGPLARVVVTAEATMLGGTYRASVVSDKDGSFEIKLLRGDTESPPSYRLTALAPAGSEHGRLEQNYDLGGLGDPQPIVMALSKRLMVSGTVVTADGAPVPAAAVVARSTSLSVPTRTSTDGTFTLPLDPDDYVFSVTPASGAPLPHAAFNISISEAALEAEGPLLLTMPHAALVAGEITTLGTTKFSSSVVEFYRVTDDGVQLVGQASVDEENHFSVALPAK